MQIFSDEPYITYDNLGEQIEVQQYVGDGVDLTMTNGVPQPPAANLLRAQTVNWYDEDGQLYQTQVFGVDPTSGTVSQYALTTNTFYDLRGEVIAQYNPGGLVTKTTYDGAGRAIVSYQTDGAGGMSWQAAQNVANDNVLQQTQTQYDNDGNAILVITRQRFDNETQTGALQGPTTAPHARVYYVASYYDAANRLIATVNVGTNGGVAWTRLDTVPNPSDTVLVTSQTYNAAGLLDTTTDPRGIVSKTYYDALGRTIETVSNYNGGVPTDSTNQTTEFGYDGDNNRLFVQIDLPFGEVEKTAYVYGVSPATGSVVSFNDMLYQVQYPDPTSGQPSTSPNQQVSYSYNALGQVIYMTDRNGTTHLYMYDVLGRQTSDMVISFGAGVDQTVQRLDTGYDTQGNAYLFTSYGDTSGTLFLNQVMDVYNDLGQLVQEYQSHTAPVNVLGLTPSVVYTYTDMAGGANNSRLTSITYPNGRVIDYNYVGIDSAISRVTSVSDATLFVNYDDQTSPFTTTVLEQDTYLGLSTVVQRSFPEAQTMLSYIQQPDDANALTDGGDRYSGLDRFGRVVDQNWFNTATAAALSRVQYGYDADSNRLYANNLLNGNFSELYHQDGAEEDYDDFNQLGYFARGVLSSSLDSITPVTSDGTTSVLTSETKTWTTDALGNVLNTTTVDSSNGTTSVTNTYNLQNQITSTTGISGAVAPQYDANGNQTRDNSGNNYFYDAWNRLVQVNSSNGSVGTRYTYDALGRRITQSSGGSQTDFYFNQNKQVIEERGGPSGATSAQYVWSPVGGNFLVERDTYDAYGNWYTGGRIFVLQDPLGSTTALVQAGVVVERYVYDPFGAVTILTAGWQINPPATVTTGNYAWKYFFQGGRYDASTGQYNFENRDLNTSEGRWSEMDPLGFGGGDVNEYCFAGDNPTDNTDPSGLSWYSEAAMIGSYVWNNPGEATSLAWGTVQSGESFDCASGLLCRMADTVAGGLFVGPGFSALGGSFGTSQPLATSQPFFSTMQPLFGNQQAFATGYNQVGNAWLAASVTAVQMWAGGGISSFATGRLAPLVGCGRLANLGLGFGVGAGTDALVQAGSMALGLQEEFSVGQMLFAGGISAVGQYLGRACFAAGTPLLWEGGSKPIEEFLVGERVWARNEFDPEGSLQLKTVEETFVRVGQVLHLHVGGQIIKTTAEHPFYVRGKGWIDAESLAIGDLLSTHDGRWLPVEDLLDTGEFETVYNLRVADFATYFVGSENWGFSVWAHNACSSTSGNNPAAVLGKAVHKEYSAAMGGLGYVTGKALPSGSVPDAFNVAQRVVRELKPNNPSAIARGLGQVERYASELDGLYPGTPFKAIVDVY